ncbi:selenoneine synthase SenA [Thiobacillus sedimenti]|uniref:Selenoneine synthase SenA n=1 Tax=Thiobacillus sedimenti TaxID=3110231 RepID=A0ABZ1CF51_9PROT|nr:selenoneine synthase SenA [Thiobacillus sp. SCUT-2]WRS37995.1 selenoneine synthase SenA [Thiobacillus sp. SCUT-2]
MNPDRPISACTADQLLARLGEARGRLRALIDCLPEGGWLGPRAAHLNPPLWEYGHIVWFQERWCLRERTDGSRTPSFVAESDRLYDSSAVPHDTRWDLPLLAPAEVDAYAGQVADAVAARLHGAFDNAAAYFAELSLYHELMHIEAWWMAFQNLGYPVPAAPCPRVAGAAQRLAFADGAVALGSGADAGFIFDNEKWRHMVPVAAFDIDARPVTETDFGAFVEAGAYAARALWSEEGWAWRCAAAAGHPLYWRPHAGGWQVRRFDRWDALDASLPMLHVNRHEAEAYAAWQGRRLPAAGEWLRAAGHPDFRWGMAWEWLREPFAPYPGFSPDPYRDYSQPWFHTHGELRGGGPVTDAALRRPGFRNFYLPDRRDPFAGFRTVGA